MKTFLSDFKSDISKKTELSNKNSKVQFIYPLENQHHHLNSKLKYQILIAPNEKLNLAFQEVNAPYFNASDSTFIKREQTTYTAPPLTVIHPSKPETWIFNLSARELYNDSAKIQLTITESLLINTLAMSTERVCGKQELIAGINKDAQAYSGLEMCLSRLQNKFRKTFEERLFRSVRNRGYCLVQDVKIAE